MQVEVRTLRIEDYDQLAVAMQEVYDTHMPIWKKETIARLLEIFPEGQLCVEVDGQVVAIALSIKVNHKLLGEKHTYEEIFDNAKFGLHSTAGDALYGIEVFVHPGFRGLRLGRRLYDARKELCERLNLKSIIAGGRMPNYHKYADRLSPAEYVKKVISKEIFDPVLAFQLANDFHVIQILPGYLKGDVESREFAVEIEWNNVYYSPTKNNLADSTIRLGLVQWQMRLFRDVQAFYEQIEFFVDVLSDYKSDFVLFPELFNAPLLAAMNDMPAHLAIRELAKRTDEIKQKISEFAISYNVNIIAGSMPVEEAGKLYNVSYLLHRDGSISAYSKIHITPNEKKYYGMAGGDAIKVIETDCGPIGILICYDVEFPELSRILADQGMKILFVPFLTDTQNAYTRVRNCAAARAIENECYVAIAGCVGNLPRVSNMDIQFGQAAVFTPSDFAFPTNGIKAEATPNAEATLIADVDLNDLKDLHHFGSVQTMKDRRRDLYSVELKK